MCSETSKSSSKDALYVDEKLNKRKVIRKNIIDFESSISRKSPTDEIRRSFMFYKIFIA